MTTAGNAMQTSRRRTALLNRIHRIQGQVNAIETALNAGRECATVLQLVAAVRGATDSLMAEMLEEHLRVHLAQGARPLAERKRGADQVVEVIRAYLR